MSIQEMLKSANEHLRAGRFAEVERLCEQILRTDPNQPDALSLMSIAARQTGRIEAAVQWASRAAAARPNVAEFHANLAEFSRQAGNLDQAVESFSKAIALKPNEPTFHNSLGTIYTDQRRYDLAEAEYRRAVQLRPDYADAYLNLGSVLRHLDRLDEAIDATSRAVQLQPNSSKAYTNLALLLTDQEKFPEAIAAYQRAIAARPDDPQAHWSLGTLYLLLGHSSQGWREYQWRPQPVQVPGPTWNGEDLHGKTILLHTEQGFGDAIQFARFIPLAAARGAKIILACNPELENLFADFREFAQIIPFGKPLPPSDVHCSLLNLHLAMGITPDAFAATIPYLKSRSELLLAWQKKLGDKRETLRVGLVWAGRAEHKDDARRSIRPELLAPLLAVKDVQFFSLQKGPAAGQAAALNLIDFTADLYDFTDTAAFIHHLDLVITVDTAVAHLAGAMGKPVWVFLAAIPDWRWMLNRPDSPWYPTMRLFRQQRRGDWTTPIDQAARELAALARSR